MNIKRVILGGAASAALLFGSLLGPAVSATAATNTGGGNGGSADQTCNSLRTAVHNDFADYQAWQIQRQEDANNGLDTSFDDQQIALALDAIHQDQQLYYDYGC